MDCTVLCRGVTCSSVGVSVGQLLNFRGTIDLYRPMRTCGDGVVTYDLHTCDALASQSPYASEWRRSLRVRCLCMLLLWLARRQGQVQGLEAPPTHLCVWPLRLKGLLAAPQSSFYGRSHRPVPVPPPSIIRH